MNLGFAGASPPAVTPVPIRPAQVAPRGLRVHTMGAFRVHHGRMPIHAIGGPKAGANQALGLFAFLFDRAERGVEKDEALELLWPDAALPTADAAFHRTMLGLRSSLRSGGFEGAVGHHAGRYVLASGLVSWSDVSEIEQLLEQSAESADAEAQLAFLETCRKLNHSDYMDDCPYYGTSVHVEPRRSLFRSVRVAVLGELAELYDALGHHALAALRRAEAVTVSEAPMPAA